MSKTDIFYSRRYSKVRRTKKENKLICPPE